MDVLLKVAIQLPIFCPHINHNPTRERCSTELRFSHWNNANAEKFNQRRRTLHEIEEEICRTRRNIAADNIINTVTTAAVSPTSETFKSLGTPSAPLEFQPGPENVKIGEDGVSYVVEGAPFDFRFSYTETPKANLVKLREPPFAPFGPPTLPWPWTGRNPVPPSQTTMREFHLLDPSPSDENGAELVRLAMLIWESREEVMGESLSKDEINRLVKRADKSSRQLHIENSNPAVSDVSGAASLPMKTCEVEITEDVMAFSCTPQMVPGTNKSSASIVAYPHSNNFLDGSEADVCEPSSCAPCTEGLLLLLDQAVEQGCALVLDDKFVDDDYIYQTTMAFSKSTPPEPLYKLLDSSSTGGVFGFKLQPLLVSEEVLHGLLEEKRSSVGERAGMVPGTNKSSASIVADPHSNNFLDGSEADVCEPSSCAPCTEGLLLLLDQAVEQGCALVLDDKFLDDDYIYQTTMAFSKSTPPEPLYKLSDRL
ncbi:hypothetical protein LR48_Vigan08g011900 [Vigna angularis]|uniref:Uncharacterized protein n=1 Tax=Phaseolus angularis TaxID=3914 RepID=A0A0L9V307_PHAAN|nr:hypothetical protein LR48_Vigan08g011900 [Vigna angularis]